MMSDYKVGELIYDADIYVNGNRNRHSAQTIILRTNKMNYLYSPS